jgi:hypothetical protein
MSDANRIQVSIVEETTFGETPGTPTLLILPTTGQSMRDIVGYQQSQTIRSDRNITDLVRLSKAAGGGLPCELTYSASGEALFSAIRAILCSTETAVTTQVTSVTSSSNVLSAGSGNVETGVEVGDILRIRDASDVLVAYVKVSAVDTGAHTVTVVGATIPNASTTYKVLRGARMKNGTTDRSFTVQVARTDIEMAQIFTGCVFAGMDINVADEAITTANFSLMAASSTMVSTPLSGSGSTAVYITGATYSSPASNAVLDSIGVPELRVANLEYAAKSLALSVNNNVAARTQIGALGPQSMRRGSFSASGRVRAYMEDFDDFTDYASNTETDAWFALIDPTHKGWSFSLPQAKFSDAGADTQGLDQDDYKDLALQAFLDPTELCTIRVQRWA